MSADTKLYDLIADGLNIIERMDGAGKLHLNEIRDWVGDTERWAYTHVVPIPEQGQSLEFVTNWEDRARAFVERLIARLRTYEVHGVVAPQIAAPGESIPSAGHIFVSYVHEDREIVLRLQEDLQNFGIRVWLDEHSISPGVPWGPAIRDGIRHGASFCACFSANTMVRDRTYMNEELIIAIEELRLRPARSSWFLPVKLTPCQIPDRDIGAGRTLQDLQFVPMFSDWRAGVRRIVESVSPMSRQTRVWLDLLRGNDVQERRNVAKALYEEPNRLALGALIWALDDRDPDVIYWAARALGRLRDSRAVPGLIRTLYAGRGLCYKLIEVLEQFHTEEADTLIRRYIEFGRDANSFCLWLAAERAKIAPRTGHGID